MRTLALLGGGGGGGNSPLKPKKCKKMEALRFFLQQILHTVRKDISCNDVDSDSC